MAANTYTAQTISGPVRTRRATKQGRKPSGLAKPELVRLYAEDDEKLKVLGEQLGYLWNRNEFIRMAVRKQLMNSVYTELLKH